MMSLPVGRFARPENGVRRNSAAAGPRPALTDVTASRLTTAIQRLTTS